MATPHISSSTQPADEKNDSGFVEERLFDGQVVIFKILNVKRQTIDAWVDACLREMKACWESGLPVRILQDFTSAEAIHTPYSRERGNEVTNAYPELKGYVAFLLQRSPEAMRIKVFLRSQRNSYRLRNAFFTQDGALAWLTRDLKPGGAAPTSRDVHHG